MQIFGDNLYFFKKSVKVMLNNKNNLDFLSKCIIFAVGLLCEPEDRTSGNVTY